MEKKQKSNLEIKNPLSAGIDVGATLMQVCVPPCVDNDFNRSFGTTTSDLYAIADWLTGNGITHAAMEATGVYWIPLFNILSRKGITVILLNAADVKNYTARKTDVNDAEWLMTLMRYGMVKPSFQVDDLNRKLRNYVRQRSTLVALGADCIRRIQKAMELMNIKLTEAISDITGVSGISIIEAILNGVRDPYLLARLADRCKKSNEDIARALEGTWDDDLIFIMGQHYEQYKFIRKQMQDLEPQLENILNRLAEKVIKANDGCLTDVARSNKRSKRKSNKLNFDIEYLSSQVYGVNLMRIDGVQGVTVLSLMGELGADFTDSFKDAAHFCSWCNLSPTDKISGGRLLSSHIRKSTNNVGIILRNCAQTIAKAQCPLGDYYRRMRVKGGGKYAVCATAHKLAVIIYTMVRNKTEYDPKKVSVTDKEWIKQRIRKHERLLLSLKHQIVLH